MVLQLSGVFAFDNRKGTRPQGFGKGNIMNQDGQVVWIKADPTFLEIAGSLFLYLGLGSLTVFLWNQHGSSEGISRKLLFPNAD